MCFAPAISPVKASQMVARASVVLSLILMLGRSGPVDSRTLPPEPTEGLGRCGYNLQVQIAPVLPSPGDMVQVTVSGDWPDSCVPTYQSHVVDNHVIRLDAAVDYPPGTACLTMITPWRFAVNVGPLSAGFHEVDLWITDMLHRVPTLCATRGFRVAIGRRKMYLPVVAQSIDG